MDNNDIFDNDDIIVTDKPSIETINPQVEETINNNNNDYSKYVVPAAIGTTVVGGIAAYNAIKDKNKDNKSKEEDEEEYEDISLSNF